MDPNPIIPFFTRNCRWSARAVEMRAGKRREGRRGPRISANTLPAAFQARLASAAAGLPPGYFENMPVPLRLNSVPAL